MRPVGRRVARARRVARVRGVAWVRGVARLRRVLCRAALPRRRRQRAAIVVLHRPDETTPRPVVAGRLRIVQPRIIQSRVIRPRAVRRRASDSTGASPAAQVLALINQARAAAGLAPLTLMVGLDSSASAHNATMAGGCGLSHQCPGEPGLGARETAAGVAWSACGENIGEGGPVADDTAAIAQMAVGLTQDMLNETPPDDGHRRNILSSSFTHIGIAVRRDSAGTVWLTQDFSN